MIKLNYIVSSLVMLIILAGCSDTKETPKKTIEIVDSISETNREDANSNPPSTVDATDEETQTNTDIENYPHEEETNTTTVEPPTAGKPRTHVSEEEKESPEGIVIENIPSNWYIRIVAEDNNRSLKTNLSQLGELEESDAVQQHTLLSGGRFANPYLDVVFVDPDGVSAGDYKTNYHVYGQGINDSWHFQVVTDDVNAEIRLSWNGLYVLTPTIDAQNRIQYTEYRSSTNPLIAKMKLIDSATGVEIPAMVDNDIQVYTFNMNGQVTRSFEWIVYYD
jgi:hypothetical protein